MIIAHRVNTLNELVANDIFSKVDGIEFDIRDAGEQIVVVHDPFVPVADCQPFAEFVRYCDPTKFYIVNVKSEGIEQRAIELLEAQGITRFFLLDCSIPMMVKLGKAGERRLAARYSEFESAETVVALAPYVSWVWVDVFTHLPLEKVHEQLFRTHGLKLCLVSPELQAQSDKIMIYRDYLITNGIQLDAVCTKIPFIHLWNVAQVLYPN